MTKFSDLGYFFDDQGVLRTEKDNEPFKFTTQEAYEELGEAVDEEIFRLLEDKCGLDKKAYSRTPEEHADTAWKTWVKPSKAKEIYVVAHSRGGYDMTTVLKKHGDDDRISKICLTDSPWFQIPKTCERRTAPLYVVNFLANGSLEKYKIGEYRAGKVQNLFAGTKIHEWSSHFSIDACFKIFEEEFDEAKFAEILESAKFLVLPREERVQRNETDDEEEEEPKEKKICV
ncbi:Protein CBG11775 [Caenorhabditis briggsae]|uniref:Protein CBG11775 n=1 Tax=Caenorhabditis briggsae TaxID=6238 RepID=A8XE01_CAEBR|nr:Protein CBG11775 [Caenorhabditis briggsae]CAP30807.2 Protein CBG11775 [Caenorhabditis briggsae]